MDLIASLIIVKLTLYCIGVSYYVVKSYCYWEFVLFGLCLLASNLLSTLVD